MDMVLAIWVICWCLKTAVADVTYAVKGQPNPRYELKAAQLAVAGQPAGRHARYGSRDWLTDLWSDGLAAQTKRRREKVARKAEAPAPTAPAAPLVAPAPQVITPVLATSSAPVATPHTAPAPASVIPLFRYASRQETPMTSTQPSGIEIGRLMPAIDYATKVAEAHQIHSGGGDAKYVSNLQECKLSGEAIASATRAQEASSLAAAAWAAHADELKKQHTVKQAYDVLPDAGDKEFLQGE